MAELLGGDVFRHTTIHSRTKANIQAQQTNAPTNLTYSREDYQRSSPYSIQHPMTKTKAAEMVYVVETWDDFIAVCRFFGSDRVRALCATYTQRILQKKKCAAYIQHLLQKINVFC